MYGFHVEVFKYHKSLQYLFTLRDLNLHQRRWLDLLKDYDMNVQYHQGKANVVGGALIRMSMGSTSHIEDDKKELAKEIHRLSRLGVRLLTLLVGVFQFILVLNHPC